MKPARRLVAVSNRVGPLRGVAAAGGLAVGIVDALRESGGLWFGWSGRTVAAGRARLHREHADGMTVATLDLPQQDFERYYNNFSNGCLWPLLHFRIDLTQYHHADSDAYRHVNRRFAATLVRLLRPTDLVWVHDFHLIPLASELRRLGARQRIGFFLHTPFPPTEILSTLPHHEPLVRALFDYDLLGFQTDEDLNRFQDHVRRAARGSVRGATVGAFGREVRAGAFPIGIDVEQVHRFAFTRPGEQDFARMRAALAGRDQIIGVDRLDYSKGLLRRMAAYERYLEQHPESHGHVIYLQVAPVSRGQLKSYREFRHEVEAAKAQINGRFSRFDWTPVHYLNRALPRRTLAGLFRASRIALVTPVRDGMNLVAKEYVAAQDAEDPGVLVLSRFAGAARQMTDALIVNPFDGEETARALHHARQMPLAERRRRHERLMRGLVEYDVRRWRNEFITALADAPTGSGRRR
ncbi:MAG: trehalose-6-phosphate synthase [Steroidobacteraceae bacterium]|nr:trehalose-6-phosphate synthase [Steroidobacteraceae bacterium]